MAGTQSGQVHKVVKVIATSDRSWEDAARNAVAEAAKTITHLRAATVVDADALIGDGEIIRYRLRLEAAFQLDRSRLTETGSTVEVRRYLIIANHTLPSPALIETIAEHASTHDAEFHVLVPESVRLPVAVDPTFGIDVQLIEGTTADRLLALDEAEQRLDMFRASLAHLGSALSGEVGVGDPLTAARRVMERSSFDEIIVSTLPPGISRWVKFDLPSRLERAFELPVTHLEQQPV